MADLIGIQLSVELAKLTDVEVQSLARDIETKLKPIKVDLDIDPKALKTIQDFNKGMQELANSAKQTEQAVKGATSTPTSPAHQKNLEKMKQQYPEVANAANKMVGDVNKATDQQMAKLAELQRTYSITQSVMSKYNKEGEESHRIFKLLDSDRQNASTLTWDMEEGTVSYTETEHHEKVNRDLKKITDERQKIYDRLTKIEQDGYGDNKQLQQFRERALNNDIDALKSLSKEVNNYGSSLSRLSKRSDLQQTINSMQTLQRTGAIRLPKGNLIDDLDNRLKNATTKKEIDEVDSRIKRLQQTLSGRDRGFLRIEKLRADDILPSSEITKVRERLRKAQTPEQVQLINTREIPALEKQNKLLREQQTETTKLTNSKDSLNKKLLQMHRNQQITTSSMERMNRVIQQADSLSKTARIGESLFSVENNARIREQTRSLQHYIDKTREAAMFRAERLQTQIYGRVSDEDQRALTNLLASMGQITVDTPHARRELDKLNQTFTQTTQRVIDADKGFGRFAGQLQAAVWRIPIYAAGVAAMYAPLTAMRDALRQIVELDTQMTVLERVSNGMIETNQAMEDSIGIAERLGNTIAEVNEGLINFARQGYRGTDLTAITEVATVMSNVSDLMVEDSASSLTAAMKGFNIEAENSIRIVDALNEVDNNYSITTTQLAQAIERSAGTARVYGSTLENLVGYVTAVGQVTRESGSVIGNSLKSIFSRITSIPAAVEGLADIGISVRDSADEMRSVDDILAELAGKWNGLSKAQQQHLGVNIAG